VRPSRRAPPGAAAIPSSVRSDAARVERSGASGARSAPAAGAAGPEMGFVWSMGSSRWVGASGGQGSAARASGMRRDVARLAGDVGRERAAVRAATFDGRGNAAKIPPDALPRVDLGRARVGLALGDDVLRTARAHRTLRRTGLARDLARFARVASDFEVSASCSAPAHMDGTEGPRRAGPRLRAQARGGARGPGGAFDERLSTFEAESRLRERGLSARIDARWSTRRPRR